MTKSAINLWNMGIFYALFAMGCSSAPTQILTTINSDFPVPASLDRIVVRSFEMDGTAISNSTFTLRGAMDVASSGTFALPLSFALVPENGDVTRHAVLDISGYAAGSPNAVVDRKVIVGFEKNQTTHLDIFLPRACADVSCSPDKTCGDIGSCVPILVQTTHDAGADANVSDAAQNDSATATDMHVASDAPANDMRVVDGGVHDLGAMDAATDAGAPDAATTDASVVDATTHDATVFGVPTYTTSAFETLNAPHATDPGNGDPAVSVQGCAMSGDGSVIATNGVREVDGDFVSVYVLDSGAFPTAPTITLTAPSGANGFGRYTPILSADGTLLVVPSGGPSNAAMIQLLVYRRSGGTFPATPSQTLSVPSGTDNFTAISLSRDARTLVAAGTNFVFVYTRGGASFGASPTQTIPAPSGAALFGGLLAVSGDASTFAVTGTSTIYVYEKTSGTFATAPSQTITAPSEAHASGTLEFTDDASMFVYGATTTTPDWTAFVYSRSGSSFALSSTATTHVTADFGVFTQSFSANLRSDGNELIVSNISSVSCNYPGCTGSADGRVLIFERSGARFHLAQTLTPGTGTSNDFGWYLGVSDDGNTLIALDGNYVSVFTP